MNTTKTAYLQHGAGTQGPFRTESVPVFYCPLALQLSGRQYTASGYGAKIPTAYMVKFEGRMYRVFCRIYSNAGTRFIVFRGERIIVNID